MGNPKKRRQLDTTIEIVTHENVEFTFQVAGMFRRLPAFALDMVIVVGGLVLLGLLFLLIAFFLPSIFGIIGGIYFIVLFLSIWFYGGLFETFWNGQTPGKRVLGLRVLTVDGQPINMFQAFLRNILRAADILPYFTMFGIIQVPCGMVGLAVSGVNRRFQRLGDLAAGTMVVLEDASWGQRDLIRFSHPDVLKIADDISPAMKISPSCEKALSLYIQRRKSLTQRRREEIAHYLAGPLMEVAGIPRGVNPDLFLCGLYQKIVS